MIVFVGNIQFDDLHDLKKVEYRSLLWEMDRLPVPALDPEQAMTVYW